MLTKRLQLKEEKDLESAFKHILEAEVIVVGAGAGLSAAAGLNYLDAEFFRSHYRNFIKAGYKNVWDGITQNWRVTKDNARTYWGFWAHHINAVFYKPDQLGTYKDLYKLLSDKKHFIITTNGDGQFYKGLFDPSNLFAMQGNYGYFQCQQGCHERIYKNEDMIRDMLNGFDTSTLKIRKKDIPYCPQCGELLCPNLRVDQYFIEKEHMINKDAYIGFINEACDQKVVFLELGVGFNTPVIIRYPFERMTKEIKNAQLIRVNKSSRPNSKVNSKKILELAMDIDTFIKKYNEEEEQ